MILIEVELKGIIVDIDYVTRAERGIIRINFKSGDKNYKVYDKSFYPYFYLLPSNQDLDKDTLLGIKLEEEGKIIEPYKIDVRNIFNKGKEYTAFKIFLENPKNVPKLSKVIGEFGVCYESDIVFWKRYLIDKDISALSPTILKAHEEDSDLCVDEIRNVQEEFETKLTHICFDIETYNPTEMARPEKDPVIMISYATDTENGVLTTKQIPRDFVKVLGSEKELLEEFSRVIERINPDIIAGYNSSNFDVPYLLTRAEKTKADLKFSRYEKEQARKEHHGLIEAIRIPGRINFDVYNVAKFIAIVGTAEKVIKVNNFKLDEVYFAVTGKRKKMVDKKSIWQQWDNGGGELANLADYSLEDSVTLNELYKFFIPLEMEIARVAGLILAETAISTTSQLVEFTMMKYAFRNKEIIPNKPGEEAMASRLDNRFVGAYVKTPDAGIYDNIVVFDFRGLYPSIIIAHNIDPSTLCTDCTDYFEAPTGNRFRKDRKGIAPMVLEMLIESRREAKKAYKKNPDNKTMASRSQALKIIANALYGYLGYARSRWYSRECASSVTAYGRLFITKTMEDAEKAGFSVLYGDTDSFFLLMKNKEKKDVEALLKQINDNLPHSMELELEGYYTRGVFVGKRGAEGGAKKKYALLSDTGRMKIMGFELVRRDWAKVAKDTQLAVLETILKEGNKEKAVQIVKDVISRLRENKVALKDLVIHTQLRKGLRSYDIKSPELSAAKKAVERGLKTRKDLEGATIGYIITRNGKSISEKAEPEEIADNYDADYYINHQIIPPTMKILKELGYSEDELKAEGSQKKL